MSLLFSLIMSAGTLALTVGIYYGVAVVLFVLLQPIFASYGFIYGPEDSVGDATGVLLVLLLWDRYFGPYGKALRKVCRYLPTGREAVTESYEYDR